MLPYTQYLAEYIIILWLQFQFFMVPEVPEGNSPLMAGLASALTLECTAIFVLVIGATKYFVSKRMQTKHACDESRGNQTSAMGELRENSPPRSNAQDSIATS